MAIVNNNLFDRSALMNNDGAPKLKPSFSAGVHQDNIGILYLSILSLFGFGMTDVRIRELDWYLRDHLFKQSNKGRQEFEQRDLPPELIKTYLRYRNDDLDQISQLVDIVVGNLLHQHVIKKKDVDSFVLRGTLKRLQCSKCYYVSILAEAEEISCLRCNSRTLDEFPKKSIKH
jgi:hypothetical protein